MTTQWHKVANLTELPPGQMLEVTASRTPVCLYNLDGEICATAARCTHGDASLAEGMIVGGEIELRGPLEHLAVEVGGLPEAGASVAVGPGVALDPLHQLRHAPDVQRRGHAKHHRGQRDARDGLEILDRVVAARLVEDGVLDVPRDGEQQRVAVRRRPLHLSLIHI